MKKNKTITLATTTIILILSPLSIAQDGPSFDFSAQSAERANTESNQEEAEPVRQAQQNNNQNRSNTEERSSEIEGQAGDQAQQRRTPQNRRVYPDQQREIPDNDELGVMLYNQELRDIESQERELLRQLYETRRLKEYRDLYKDERREEAYRESRGDISELTPEMIRSLREYGMDIEKAQNEPIKDVEHMMRSKEVDVNSNRPLDVYLSPGNQASIVFYDQGGNPWPLESEPQYNESAFNAQIAHQKGHIVTFTLDRAFSQSNAIVNLKGMNTPIIIRLIGSENRIDARLSARIPRYGPNMNESPQVYSQVDNASPDLLQVQNGEPLQGSLEYGVEGVNQTRAYYKNGDLYIRTKHLLLIPNPKEASTLPSGYNTYVIPAKRDLMFSVDGEYVDARITEMEKPQIQKEQSIFQ